MKQGPEGTVAARIDRAIRERGWTNRQASFQLGVTERTVLAWRRDEVGTPLLRHAHKLAEVFGGEWSDYYSEPKEAAA